MCQTALATHCTVRDNGENLELFDRPRKVFDVMTVMDEEDLLTFRVHLLNPVVDVFVLVMCNTTFSNQSVELLDVARIEKLRPFHAAGRLVTVLCNQTFPTATQDPWVRENALRDHAMAMALNLSTNDDDLFLFGDVDEIPSPQVLTRVLRTRIDGVIGLHMPLFKYHFGCLLAADACATAIVTRTEALKHSRMMRGSCAHAQRQIYCAGWHCSNCLPPKLIQHKFYTFSHFKDANFPDSMKELGYINDSIASCSHGPSKYTCTEDTEGLPELIWLDEFRRYRPHSCT